MRRGERSNRHWRSWQITPKGHWGTPCEPFRWSWRFVLTRSPSGEDWPRLRWRAWAERLPERQSPVAAWCCRSSMPLTVLEKTEVNVSRLRVKMLQQRRRYRSACVSCQRSSSSESSRSCWGCPRESSVAEGSSSVLVCPQRFPQACGLPANSLLKRPCSG